MLVVADRSSSAVELIAPAEDTTIPALTVRISPPWLTSMPVAFRPDGSVRMRRTYVSVTSVTPPLASAGLTRRTSASPFAPILQAKPSQVPQRAQAPPSW